MSGAALSAPIVVGRTAVPNTASRSESQRPWVTLATRDRDPLDALGEAAIGDPRADEQRLAATRGWRDDGPPPGGGQPLEQALTPDRGLAGRALVTIRAMRTARPRPSTSPRHLAPETLLVTAGGWAGTVREAACPPFPATRGRGAPQRRPRGSTCGGSGRRGCRHRSTP